VRAPVSSWVYLFGLTLLGGGCVEADIAIDTPPLVVTGSPCRTLSVNWGFGLAWEPTESDPCDVQPSSVIGTEVEVLVDGVVAVTFPTSQWSQSVECGSSGCNPPFFGLRNVGASALGLVDGRTHVITARFRDGSWTGPESVETRVLCHPAPSLQPDPSNILLWRNSLFRSITVSGPTGVEDVAVRVDVVERWSDPDTPSPFCDTYDPCDGLTPATFVTTAVDEVVPSGGSLTLHRSDVESLLVEAADGPHGSCYLRGSVGARLIAVVADDGDRSVLQGTREAGGPICTDVFWENQPGGCNGVLREYPP